MFSIFQETPFTTRDLEFIYFFFPYILTATIPTLLALGWKNVNPNRALADEQFWLSTCYVQVRSTRVEIVEEASVLLRSDRCGKSCLHTFVCLTLSIDPCWTLLALIHTGVGLHAGRVESNHVRQPR